MKETRADTRTALLQALGLHAVMFALMFAGLNWTRSNIAEAAHGEVIEADLVDPSALSAAMRSALQRTPEALPQPVVEPEPEPPPPEPLPQPVAEEPPPPVPDPEPVEQEKVQRDAESPEVAKAPVEQEERRKPPPQADLDAEKKRQQRLADIRKRLDQARLEADMAEMRAQQIADARARQQPSSNTASPPRGNPDSRSAENARYSLAVKDAITRQWVRPESIPMGVPCQVRIRQIPGGEVVDVQVSGNCPYDDRGKQSLERAVLKASPLPYAGFEDVFSRDIILTFRPEDVDDLRR